MKHFTSFIMSLFLLGMVHAQNQDVFAYDWHQVLAGKPILKINVYEDGLYQLSRQTIIANNPSFANVPSDSLRLLFRGEEIPLHILFHGNPGWEEIRFLGKYHDGGEDRLLYRNNIQGQPDPSFQTNPRVSLFSDTSAYYLVASSRGTALRWQDIGDFNFSRTSPESNLSYTTSLDFLPGDTARSVYAVSGGSAYDSFNSLNSDYVLGEGYVSRVSFGQGDPASFSLPTPAAVPGQQQVAVAVRVFGRSNTPHRFRLSEEGSGQVIMDTSWNSNQIYLKTYHRTFSTTPDSSVTLVCEALSLGSADNNHLLWLDLQYQRLPDLDSMGMVRFEDVPAGSLLRLTHSSGRDSIWAYSEKTGQRFRGIIQGDTAWLDLAALPDTSDLLVVSDNAVKTPEIETSKPRSLCHPDSGAHMIMVTRRDLETSARAYADFRDSSGFSVKVFFIDEIYEAFGYGAPTPLALQRFCNCALSRWNTQPRYLLLWGDAYPTYRESPGDQVLTWGFPATDLTFTAPLHSTDFVPQFPAGRVPVAADSAGFHYLEKARVWADGQRKEAWMLNGAFASGGFSAGIIGALREAMDAARLQYANGAMNGNAACYLSKPDTATGALQPDSCHYESAGFRYYFGNSSAYNFDNYLLPPAAYNDSGTASFVFAMGNNSADFTAENSLAEQWLAYPEKGAVAWLGITSAGYLSPLRIYSEIFMPRFANTMVEQPIGDVMRATIRKFADSIPGIQTKNHLRQMNVLGDPSLVLSRRRYPLFIGSLPQSPMIRLYPNPASGFAYLSASEGTIQQVALIASNGACVKRFPVAGRNPLLDLADVRPGLYLVRVYVGGRWLGRKLRVE